ncbi:MAG: helix-turn-helix domain-containing protein [Bdellovibrionales bacterium]|nr:helix-turn-helix domain-containing protein [Bdellovibrionales bacterium]
MSYISNEQTYYELLEVSPDAPQDEIHRAYQRAKETYSPDSPALYTMFTREEALELSKLIEEAYHVLSNKSKRRDYDLQLVGHSKLSPEELSNDSQVLQDGHEPTPKPQSKLSNDVPDGHKKTRFGSYQVKPEMEDAIENTMEWDGSFLRKVRVYKNISLEQLSAETKISRTYLKAVEDNNFDKLPARVFVRGFVVQLAKALSLDENKVAKSYMNMVK